RVSWRVRRGPRERAGHRSARRHECRPDCGGSFCVDHCGARARSVAARPRAHDGAAKNHHRWRSDGLAAPAVRPSAARDAEQPERICGSRRDHPARRRVRRAACTWASRGAAWRAHARCERGMSATSGTDAVRGNGPQLSGTNLVRAGDHNQRVTLHAIRVNGPITRSDLVDITGLTPPAIANITKRLLQDDLIMEAGHRRGGRGQPATKLVINPDSCFSVGINVDRDHITLVVLGFDGHVRARASREIAFAMPQTVQSFFRSSIGRLLKKARIKPNRLLGIGVAFPDDIQRADLPEQPPEYAEWGSVAVDRLLAATLPVPVFVEND